MDAKLDRFLDAQVSVYDTALAEISAGAKTSHWMWFIFPQLRGLGHSPTAHHYGITSLSQARAYLNHPILGSRYLDCLKALQALAGSDPVAVFGPVDAMKLRSSLTLFEAASATPLFEDVFQRWFDAERDGATLHLLAQVRRTESHMP